MITLPAFMLTHWRWLAIGAAVVAACPALLGYRTSLIDTGRAQGRQSERAEWQQRERERLALEESIRRTDARQAVQLADAADARVRELRTFADRLTLEARDAALVVSDSAPGACAGPVGLAAVDAAGHGPGHADPRAPAALGEPAQRAADGGTGVRLTAGALRLWNSALAGVDVGAGACTADDPTGAACAADTGIELAEVWRNHIDNAGKCAEDRARHNALIDMIEGREALMRNKTEVK